MNLSQIDWAVIGFYFLFSFIIGVLGAKKAGKDARSFFLASGDMPWWLLGVSMVATTFSTDTPNLVTDLVRQKGVDRDHLSVLWPGSACASCRQTESKCDLLPGDPIQPV